MKAPLYRHIASKLQSISNCITSKNTEWQARHENDLDHLVKEFMPSGSGIDSGTKLDIMGNLRDLSRIEFTTAFHHMNESGMYDGWTEHKIIVKASLSNQFDLKITGRDRNGIKEYLHEVFDLALLEVIDKDEQGDYFSPSRRESARKFQEAGKNGVIV